MSASDRPNILLLVVDALRADAVEGYGGPVGSSPTLGQLGRSGAAIDDVRTTASWTLPAHTAMFTGRLARGLGLGQAPNQSPQGAAPVVREERACLLADVLSRAGYQSQGVTGNGWAGSPSGFDAGFEQFVDLELERQSRLGGGWANRARWVWEGIRARVDDGASEAETVLQRWISEPRDRPFFWFVNLVECHSPYLPPKPYTASSALVRARAADEAFRYLTFASILQACLGKLTVPAAAIERMRDLYRASLRYVDDWLGRVLDRLSDAGVLEDTLVIVTADHGENFGVGGLMGHGMSLDDRLLRVPFVVSGPGVREFNGIRSLAELPSRIAAAVRLPDHPWPGGLPAGLPVAQWDPFDLDEQRRANLAKDWALDEAELHRLATPLTCAVAGRLKLVRGATPEDEWLYDLDEDPLELSPMRGPEAIAARAGEALMSLRAAVNHEAVQAAAKSAPIPDQASPEEVAEIEHRMRLMGYM
jgi:arylsulfatase A-like enzyme